MYFRLGRLHLNAGGLCPIRPRAIMEYWQIDELLLGTIRSIKNFNKIFTFQTHVVL